ncbi:bacterial polymer biosynthesis protein (WecB/TagA/CpsF family) [Rubidibacter lacunae KORDI 51-2]|uniref:Bacterial polymer biosynthesis protein (WecB/TagA/CpsF family) n=1 Tax=Rubidibacter lacunae KORDI 51-2 TaxID=582515 RepID=U5DPB1_9CHRO|nr:WecB/TagA/CpsF family glycosyltransferase [Rubidibacter lacunae]ERN42677.1 bacterial polymer biosynthesis protein (WecB/TagA/CpsF family) [Rubidibacter lacunae KORDI 51-2]
MMNQVDLLNVQVDNLTQTELLEGLRAGGFVVTPNVDHLSKLQRDPEFYRIYRDATYRVCDSQILMYASRWLGTPLREKISGSDLLPAFCQHYRNDPGTRVFLLGGAPGVAEQARARLNTLAGREVVVGTHAPSFGFEQDESECQSVLNIVQRSGANVLVLALGTPKQELWFGRYQQQLPTISSVLAVGAAVDFAAGQSMRAPRWMSYTGLEWLHRLWQEPRRLWRRYLLDDVPVLWLLTLQRFGRYRVPQWMLAPEEVELAIATPGLETPPQVNASSDPS